MHSHPQVEGSARLFLTAQMIAGHVRRFMMATSADITFVEPGLANLFERSTSNKEVSEGMCVLCVCV